MVWRIVVEWLEDEEAVPDLVAHGRICHLDKEHGAERRDFHSYWEIEPNALSSLRSPARGPQSRRHVRRRAVPAVRGLDLGSGDGDAGGIRPRAGLGRRKHQLHRSR